jgi:hypothetical protein
MAPKALAIACVAASVGCASAHSPSASSLDRPGLRWPADVERCSIVTPAALASCMPNIDVFETPGGRMIATVARRDLVDARWSELPVLGTSSMAKVVAMGEGMGVVGWASLEDQWFELQSSLPIVRGRVWIPSGSAAQILGTSGANLALRLRTPFRAPSSIELLAPCEAIGSSTQSPRLPSGPPFAIPRGWVDLRPEPNGPVVFSFEPSPEQAFVLFERRSGAAHISVTESPWPRSPGTAAVLVDGWVDESKIDVRSELDRPMDMDDGGCGLLDSNDSCSAARVIDPTPLFVGHDPGGAPIGSVSGFVTVGERSGDFAAVTTANSVFQPPPGQRFWVKASEIHEDCFAVEDTGCPCSEPMK